MNLPHWHPYIILYILDNNYNNLLLLKMANETTHSSIDAFFLSGPNVSIFIHRIASFHLLSNFCII